MKRPLGHTSRLLPLAVALAVMLAFGGVTAASAHFPGPHPISPNKEAMLSHQFSRPANAASPAAKDPGYRPSADFPRRPDNLGVIRTTDLQPPISPTLFTPTTEWMDWRGTIQIQVYGGTAADDPAEGVIFVWEVNLTTDLDSPGTGAYVAPIKTGALVLTKVDGDVVSFSYPGGAGTFDLASHKFTTG